MSEGDGFRVRRAWAGDVAGMVECHRQAFAGQFLTLLGERFLREHYDYYVAQPDATALVAEGGSDGEVVGLVVGGPPGLRTAFTLTSVPRLAPDVLRAAAADGRVRWRLAMHAVSFARGMVAALFDGPPEPRVTLGDEPGTWTTLLSICVRPAHEGKGIGRALLAAFEADAAGKGFASAHLSVHSDNVAAVRLYERCGWDATVVAGDGVYFKKRLRPARAPSRP